MSFQSGVSAEESAPSTAFMHIGPQRPLAYPANTRESAPATPPVPGRPMSSERRVPVCTVEHGQSGGSIDPVKDCAVDVPWDNDGALGPPTSVNIPCPYFRMARRCAWDRSRGATP